MTRKDYEAFAEAIRVGQWNTENGRWTVDQVVQMAADVFRADNARFDRDRFVAACVNPKFSTEGR